MIKVEIKGLKEAYAVVKNFPKNLENKVIANANRKAIDPMYRQAKDTAPVVDDVTQYWGRYVRAPGTLKKAIRVKQGTFRGNKYAAIQIIHGRIRTGAKKGEFTTTKTGAIIDAWYWRFVEFGHKIVRDKKQIGFVPATPFLRSAIKANTEAAYAIFKQELWAGTEIILPKK